MSAEPVCLLWRKLEKRCLCLHILLCSNLSTSWKWITRMYLRVSMFLLMECFWNKVTRLFRTDELSVHDLLHNCSCQYRLLEYQFGDRNLIYQNNKNVSAYKYISREQAGYSIVMREVNISTLLTTSNSVLGQFIVHHFQSTSLNNNNFGVGGMHHRSNCYLKTTDEQED